MWTPEVPTGVERGVRAPPETGPANRPMRVANPSPPRPPSSSPCIRNAGDNGSSLRALAKLPR